MYCIYPVTRVSWRKTHGSSLDHIRGTKEGGRIGEQKRPNITNKGILSFAPLSGLIPSSSAQRAPSLSLCLFLPPPPPTHTHAIYSVPLPPRKKKIRQPFSWSFPFASCTDEKISYIDGRSREPGSTKSNFLWERYQAREIEWNWESYSKWFSILSTSKMRRKPTLSRAFEWWKEVKSHIVIEINPPLSPRILNKQTKIHCCGGSLNPFLPPLFARPAAKPSQPRTQCSWRGTIGLDLFLVRWQDGN